MTLPDTGKPGSSSGHVVRAWVAPWRDAQPDVYAIRQEMFVEEQHLTNSVYDDPDDELSEHVLAVIGERLAGVGRVTYIFDDAQIAWVAVRKPFRRHGVGWAIIQRLIDVSLAHGAAVISLNAQTHALDFYHQLGFHAVGRKFYMGGIEHQHMIMDVEERHLEARS